MNNSNQPDPSSPPWQPGTRLVVTVLLILIALLILSSLQQLIVPLVLSFLLAYLLNPIVTRLTQRFRMRRGWAVLVVYVALFIIIMGLTTGLGFAVSPRVVHLGSYLRELSVELPVKIEALAEQQVSIGPWQIDLSQINLEPILREVASAVQPLLSQTGNLLASLARSMASAVTLFVMVMVIGFYVLVDFGTMDDALLEWVPVAYRRDFRRLIDEMVQVWNSFFRGQAILAVVVGLAVAIILSGLGVRFALALGLIAGLMEFVPMFGPFIAGLVTFLVALFQGINRWGLSPSGFGMLVLIVFLILQQIENNVLVPRIIGHNLNLSPLAVLLSILAGGMLAGMLGLLLAAPTVATMKIFLGYTYRKIVGLDVWPESFYSHPPPHPRRFQTIGRLWSRWRARSRRRNHLGPKEDSQ